MSTTVGIFVTLMLVTLVLGGRRDELRSLGFEHYPDVGYYAVGIGMNWTDAEHDCVSRGAKLAVINSEGERAALVDIMSKYGSATPYYFAGFTNSHDYKTYITTDGLLLEETGYTKWEAGHPLDQQQRCGVIVSKSGELSDDDCHNIQNYICEVQLWSEYDYFEGLGYYKMYTEGEEWADAYKTCKRDGAHLMVLDTYAEAQVARMLYNEHPHLPTAETSDYIYTGFRSVPDVVERDPYKNKYLTIFGSSVSNLVYVNWAYNEPNTDNSALCGTLERNTMAYKMYVCDKLLAFICEKESEDFIAGSSMPATPGTTSYPQYGTTSYPHYGTTSYPHYGTTCYPQYGTTSYPHYGTTGYPNYGTTSYPHYGTTGYPNYDPTRYPNYGTTNYPNYDPTRYPNYGTTKYPNYDPTRYPNYGTTKYPNYDPTRYPNYGTTKYPNYDPTRYPNYDTTKHPNYDTTTYPNYDPTRYPNYDTTTYPNYDPTRYPNYDTTRYYN